MNYYLIISTTIILFYAILAEVLHWIVLKRKNKIIEAQSEIITTQARTIQQLKIIVWK